MASPVSAQQPAQQRTAEESLEEFHTRMMSKVSRLEMADTIFFYKRVSRSMGTELVQGQLAYALEIPLDFLLHHGKKLGKQVTFATPDNHQTWPIKITIRNFRGARSRVFAYGPGGWRAFVIDNHIKVGDVLIFDLTRFSHFEVHIGRSPVEVPSDDNNSAEEDNADEDNATLEGTSSHKPLRPKFEVTICRPSNAEHPENHFYLEKDLSLVVPSQFWELHSSMLEGDELQLKGPAKTVKRVKVERTHNEEVQMVRLGHSGWKAFLLANNLAVGDVIEFSLIAKSSLNVKVVE